MRETIFLFQHFWRADIRSKHGVSGLVLFAVATVYATYQIVGGDPDPKVWNAMAWVILLFTSFNGVSRMLEEDRPEVLSYLRSTVRPIQYVMARTLHNVLVLGGLSCMVLAFLGLLIGWSDLEGSRLLGFLAAMIGTAIALGSMLTLLALIAARAGGGFGMTAVLGLPLVLPIVLVCTNLGQELLQGNLLSDTWHHFVFLGALTVGSGVLGAVLFPYLWRAT